MVMVPLRVREIVDKTVAVGDTVSQPLEEGMGEGEGVTEGQAVVEKDTVGVGEWVVLLEPRGGEKEVVGELVSLRVATEEVGEAEVVMASMVEVPHWEVVTEPVAEWVTDTELAARVAVPPAPPTLEVVVGRLLLPLEKVATEAVLEWLLVEEVVLQEDWEEEAVEEVVRVARGVVEALVVPVMEAVLVGEEVKLWVGRAVTLIRAVLLWDRVTEVVMLDM